MVPQTCLASPGMQLSSLIQPWVPKACLQRVGPLCAGYSTCFMSFCALLPLLWRGRALSARLCLPPAGVSAFYLKQKVSLFLLIQTRVPWPFCGSIPVRDACSLAILPHELWREYNVISPTVLRAAQLILGYRLPCSTAPWTVGCILSGLALPGTRLLPSLEVVGRAATSRTILFCP